jgi:hypothetical protein
VTTIAALGLYAAIAPSAGAGDRVALVGCDLRAQGGPAAIFLQIAGEKRNRSGFVFRSGNGSENVAGRSCAQVLADVADDGFEFRDADLSAGSFDEWISIWQDDD